MPRDTLFSLRIKALQIVSRLMLISRVLKELTLIIFASVLIAFTEEQIFPFPVTSECVRIQEW